MKIHEVKTRAAKLGDRPEHEICEEFNAAKYRLCSHLTDGQKRNSSIMLNLNVMTDCFEIVTRRALSRDDQLLKFDAMLASVQKG